MNRKMPVLFVGHGSPMNAIEHNSFTKKWREIADIIPKPKAILAISAHWYTSGSKIAGQSEPEMIYDMYGFPKELYEVVYNAKGAPELSEFTKNLITRNVKTENSWGIDHGTWSVLCNMYPNADIPVFQLSIDKTADANVHFKMGQEISALKDEGILIFGSGNIVHNLRKISWEQDGGYPWAIDFDNYIKNNILKRQYNNVIEYETAGESSKLAFTSPDHFFPLLYVLGASADDDKITVFNDSCTMGSLSMTSYLFK